MSLSSLLKDISKGTGLGLATVYGIVKQSGGEVTVKSAPGQGAVFTMYFPLIPRIDAVLPQLESARPVTGHETLLFVEDETPLLNLGRRILESYGYKVLTAVDGPGALELLREHSSAIALLVTDLVLPGMNGTELARKAGEQWPGLRVLYMSGYTNNVVARHEITEATVAFIQKPFSAEALALKVRLILDAPAGDARP